MADITKALDGNTHGSIELDVLSAKGGKTIIVVPDNDAGVSFAQKDEVVALPMAADDNIGSMDIEAEHKCHNHEVKHGQNDFMSIYRLKKKGL